jgi:hypothetical protein
MSGRRGSASSFKGSLVEEPLPSGEELRRRLWIALSGAELPPFFAEPFVRDADLVCTFSSSHSFPACVLYIMGALA